MKAQDLDSVQLKPGQARDYLAFLNQAVKEINSSPDYTVTLKSVAQAMVPKMSDWCAVDIVQANGRLKRLAIAHTDPSQIKKAFELSRKYPRDPNAESGTPHVFKTGESETRNDITDDMLVASASNDEHLSMMRQLNFKSMMIVPIKSLDKIYGTLTLVWTSSKKAYSIADLAFAETLATVAGAAIENSRLHHATARR